MQSMYISMFYGKQTDFLNIKILHYSQLYLNRIKCGVTILQTRLLDEDRFSLEDW